MTPSEIARFKAESLLGDHRELAWLTRHLETLEVQFMPEMPKPRHPDGDVYGHILTDGLYVVEYVYVDDADTFVDEDGVIDATSDTREYWLVVTDPTALGIEIDSLDAYDRKKFVKTAP